MTTDHTNKKKQTLSGTVVGNKMKDTVVVEVNRFVAHPKYRKYMNLSTRIKAHDAGNRKQMGEKVEIISCRPLSKDKHFKIV